MSGPATDDIVVDHLTKQYKKLRAVDDLSFSVRSGRVTGFLGPNGAGKTTTLRMLLGLVTPTAGTATLGGRKYTDLSDPIKHVGAVLEASSAHRGRTGRNHLRMICKAAGLPDSRADVPDRVLQGGIAPAADGRRARRRVHQAEQHPQGGGLAGAVRAQEAGDPAGAHGEREIVHSPQFLVLLGQVSDDDLFRPGTQAHGHRLLLRDSAPTHDRSR